MMKLRHLFDNRDLAVMLLGYWDRDADRLDVLVFDPQLGSGHRVEGRVCPHRSDRELVGTGGEDVLEADVHERRMTGRRCIGPMPDFVDSHQ